MKIVLWIGDGANQKALANKINSIHKIEFIIIETKKSKAKLTLSKIIEKIVDKLIFSSIHKAWPEMMRYYEKNNSHYPNTKIIYTDNINNESVYKDIINISPDLVVVSGTRMVKEKLLSLKPKLGIVNLHTGLSPYIKGGPNCTNWCIANGDFHLIGNTIMWIDKGIDSGNIIETELTPFTGKETLENLHMKVMEHAHELYIHAIDKIIKGEMSSVSQDEICHGTTYYTKNWGVKQKFNMLRNFKKFDSIVSSELYKSKQLDVKTISFDKTK